jgi:hypothetical protein
MDGHAIDLGSFGPGGAGAADSQVCEAGQWHRIAAAAITVVVAVGGPVGTLLIAVPTLLPFIELVILVIPLLLLSTSAWVMMRWATVTSDGTRVTPGQLVAGLRPVRGEGGPRLVRVADAPELAFEPNRVAMGTLAFGLTGLVAFILLTGGSWLAYNIAFQEQIAAQQQAVWDAKEPQAAALKDALVAELLAGSDRAGETLVEGQAAEALPSYRRHLAADRVTGFEVEGNGSGGGQWEYMLRERSSTSAGLSYPLGVTITIEERGDRLVVTQIVRN